MAALRLSVSNFVTIDGVTISDDGNHDRQTVEVSEGGATADIDGVTICKVDADNNGITLAGAEFNLYIWDEDGGTDGAGAYVPMVWDASLDGGTYCPAVGNETPATLVTRSDGTLEIKLGYNVAYRLVETKAPEHYQKDESSYDFLILSADGEEHPYVGPGENVDEFKSSGGHELSSGALIYYPNTCTTTDISVIKRWEDSDGTDVTRQQTGSVTFELWRREIQSEESSGGTGNEKETTTVSVDVKMGNEWGSLYWQIEKIETVENTEVSFSMTYGNYYSPTPPAPSVYLNGVLMTPTVKNETISDGYNTGVRCTYTFRGTVCEGENSIVGYTNDYMPAYWTHSELTYVKPSAVPEPTESHERVQDEKVCECTITSENGWMYTFDNLPKKSESGNDYIYYVVEVDGEKYGVTYFNNNGITYGAITITNRVPDEPENPTYTLPETGGGGILPYALGGALLLMAAVFLLYIEKRRGVLRPDR